MKGQQTLNYLLKPRIKMTVLYMYHSGATAVSRPIARSAGDVCDEAVGDPAHGPGGVDPVTRHRPLPRQLLRLAAGREPPG